MTEKLNPNHAIRHILLFFNLSLLAAVLPAAALTGQTGEIFSGLETILFSPCPLVTDYFRLGNLPAALLNAGLCGLACMALIFFMQAECTVTTWAGFFLVIAHCFYGLNLVNMWPPILGTWLYCRCTRSSLKDNLGLAYFSTAFGPFFSELLFRYPVPWEFDVSFGPFALDLSAMLPVVLLALFLGFTIPAMLPGAFLLHRGYNLYNGGFAFGLLGMVIFAFLYKTQGVVPAAPEVLVNAVYESHGESYFLFGNVFFLFLFTVCLFEGWLHNGKSFKGYGRLLKDSGHRSDLAQEYGIPCTLINVGLYGYLVLAYFDAVILLTDGAGFTGPTFGVILAAMTFSATGQHPKNVWPVLGGFVLLSLLVAGIAAVTGRALPWTLSTQAYMNAAAFATGLCPFTGVYGPAVGALAGMLCATICTSTSAIHGGFMLYNGGFSAGLAAIILMPMLERYYTGRTKEEWDN